MKANKAAPTGDWKEESTVFADVDSMEIAGSSIRLYDCAGQVTRCFMYVSFNFVQSLLWRVLALVDLRLYASGHTVANTREVREPIPCGAPSLPSISYHGIPSLLPSRTFNLEIWLGVNSSG